MLPEFANCGVGTSLFWPRIWRNRGLGSLAKSYFSGRPFCKCFRFFSAGLGAWDRPEGELTVQEGRLRLSREIVSSGGAEWSLDGIFDLEYTWGVPRIFCKLLISF